MIDFNMSKLLNRTKSEYTITRTSKTIVKGVSKSTGSTTFTTSMTVTNAKKEDYIALDIGNSRSQVLKIRILNEESNQLEIGDKFYFKGRNYEITRDRPYAEGMTDFSIFYAFIEVVR